LSNALAFDVVEPPRPALRIGELARRVGASPELLRAWERRYGVLHPTRTSGGYRLYGPEDERRARRMLALIAEGWAAAEAAAAVSAEPSPGPGGEPAPAPGGAEPAPGPALEPLSVGRLAGRLEAALLAYDAPVAHAALDHLVATHPLDAVLRDVVLPVLRAVGDGWEDGTVSIAQEHFAAELVGTRLRGLAGGWSRGPGPQAVLACPAGERHDLGLLCCGLALRERGWRVTYLGADTPAGALRDAVQATGPAAVVLGVLRAELLAPVVADLAEIAGAGVIVAIGGAGAQEGLVRAAGARRLAGDPVAAAAALTG
jgi:DNA-binding transcriptional MerR regulator/methanogenic corrinoid protein MtbC1